MSDVVELIAEIRETYRQRQDLMRAEVSLELRRQAIRRRLTRELGANGHFSSVTHSCAADGSRLAGGEAPVRGRDQTLSVTQVAGVASSDGGSDPSRLQLTATPHDGAGGSLSPAAIDELADLAALPLIDSRDLIRSHRLALDRQLEKLAKQLPAWSWVEGVRGVGALSLAQIVGESGDLSNYANPAKLWKRMGLAVMDDGTRQRRVAGDAAIEHGYSPPRRSLMWVIGDNLIRGNRDGAYRTYYLAEKERQREKLPDAPQMHVHKRAHRHMEKRFLRDLWRAWTAIDGMDSIDLLPEALATGLAAAAD